MMHGWLSEFNKCLEWRVRDSGNEEYLMIKWEHGVKGQEQWKTQNITIKLTITPETE